MSGSAMEPTLHPGQVALFNTTEPCYHRGDVALIDVTRVPLIGDSSITTVVMRVVALGGDTVTFTDGQLVVNGLRLNEKYLSPGVTTESGGSAVPPGCGAPPNGSPGCVVSSGNVFVLGDNRPASKDSRVYGPIPTSAIRALKSD